MSILANKILFMLPQTVSGQFWKYEIQYLQECEFHPTVQQNAYIQDSVNCFLSMMLFVLRQIFRSHTSFIAPSLPCQWKIAKKLHFVQMKHLYGSTTRVAHF